MLNKIIHTKKGDYTLKTRKAKMEIDRSVEGLFEKLKDKFDNDMICLFIIHSATLESCKRNIMESLEK